MSNTKKRVYISEKRTAQGSETKSRILSVAKELFQSKGFEFVTIEKLAKHAQVSSPTIYALFQSKRGILRALMDEALPSNKHLALVEEVKKEKSAKKRLLIAAKISRLIYDAERAQMDIFRGASVLSPEFKKLEKEREARRYKRLKDTDQLLTKGGFLSKEELDILWAFTGRDLYRMLVIEQGWSSDAYEKWLGELLIKTISNKTN